MICNLILITKIYLINQKYFIYSKYGLFLNFFLIIYCSFTISHNSKIMILKKIILNVLNCYKTIKISY